MTILFEWREQTTNMKKIISVVMRAVRQYEANERSLPRRC